MLDSAPTHSSLSKKYGWSHDSAFDKASESLDTRATQLAKKLIPIVEKALAKDGLEIKMGVEIEARVDTTQSYKAEQSLKRLLRHKDREHKIIRRAGRDGQRAATAEYDNYSGNIFWMKEIPHIAEYSTQPLGLLQTSYAVRHLKRGLIDNFERAEIMREAQNQIQKPIVHDQHTGSRFTASLGGYEADGYYMKSHDGFIPMADRKSFPIGEHYNLSLWQKKGNGSSKNLLSDWRFKEEFASYLACNMGHDYAFFLGHADNFKRLAITHGSKKFLYTRCYLHNKEEDVNEHLKVISHQKESYDKTPYQRIECRIPDGSCNPFLATLALGALTYAQQHHITTKENPTLPNELTQTLARFSNHSVAIPSLHHAVDQTIENEQERDEFHKDIDQLKNLVFERGKAVCRSTVSHAL